MKTLVVVSALVSLAFAAPALPGEGVEDTDRTQDWHLQAQSTLPDILKRERKSPSELSSPALASDVHNVHHIDTTHTARSFALKKPLIVKKKYGYRLYRDSEEEKAHADSNETCGRQVKVKLCDEDGKFKKPVTGSVHERADIHTTEDDVKHSIKMAKEAVENLQRDLKKMEMKTEMKTAHESQSDIELHEDIEVARQALKHIHENFGNLESMSLHSTTTRDSETMHDVHLTIAKTEEERMAQWKEAMANIQKNVEIARNIEDSFKAAGDHDTFLHLGQSESVHAIADKKIEESADAHAALTDVTNMRLANTHLETHHHHAENGVGEEIPLDKTTHEHLGDHNAREQTTEDDMKTSPTEMIETHLSNPNGEMSLRSENHKIHDENVEEKTEELNVHTENIDHHLHQEKSSELNADVLTGQSEHHMTLLPAVAALDEGMETKLDMEKGSAFKTSENVPDVHMNTHTISTNVMKPSVSDAFSEHQRSAEQLESENNIKHHLKQEKSVDDMAASASDDMIDFLAKSADQGKTATENLHNEQVVELEKAAEVTKPEHEVHFVENLNMAPKEAMHTSFTVTEEENLDHIPKTAEHTELAHLHNIDEQNENVMFGKSVDHTSIQDLHQPHMIESEELSHADEPLPQMKAVEEHLTHLKHMHNAQWAHAHSHLDHLASVKAAEELGMAHGLAHGHGINSEHTMEHLRNSHLAEQTQIPSKMGVSHDLGSDSHIQQYPQHLSRYHQNSMTHSNLHEMSGMGSAMHPNFHPSMRDAMEGFGSDHMFRWKPTHESARVAYGSGLSSSIGSPGAVGVFPNANTGGCGIPLLLSCSPSVVSGSLAKAHSAGPSSYSSPSYRTEDEFGFHNKRDIMKMNDVRTPNSLRTPSIVKQKSPINVENKM